MKTLKLSEKLLTVLTALKDRQALAITESSLFDDKKDWQKALREYFYSLPKELTDEVGLDRNELCIRAVEWLEIPQEWNETDFDELSQFTFSY